MNQPATKECVGVRFKAAAACEIWAEIKYRYKYSLKYK